MVCTRWITTFSCRRSLIPKTRPYGCRTPSEICTATKPRLPPVSRQTPTGVVQRFIVRVPKGSAALVLQTGLYSRYTKNMVLGLPGDIINGKIAQIKAAWRGAFLAGGHLSDPGKASYLEIVCPNHEAALALVSTARRLGITAKPRKLRSSERVTLRDPDCHRTTCSSSWAPLIPPANGPESVPTERPEARRTVWRTSMTQHAP